ncbi:MAG: long-chain fatty acid--CoA ligase [Candidatus Bathyarchaeia archaeon]
MKPQLRFWPEGIPKSIKYPEMPLSHLLKRAAEKYPNNTAVIFQGEKMSFKDLNLLSDRFAASLSSLGTEKGDRIALFLPNIPQFVISYYGALKAGAVVTAVSPLSKEKELAYQLNDSGAETIVALDTLHPLVKAVQRETKLKSIIITGIKDSLFREPPAPKISEESGVFSLQDLVTKSPPTPPRLEIDPKEDLAALQYTGGTTGEPKGAMLTHYNLVSNAVAFATWLQAQEGKEVFLTVLPLFHIYGMTTSMNAAIYLAAAMVLVHRFDSLEILEVIEKYGVTVFCGVPTMYILLINCPELVKYDLSSIRFCVSGGAPLPPDVQKRFMKLTGGVLIEGYGLTEASPVTHVNPIDPTMKTVRAGSIGLVLPDTEAKIVDLETGTKDLSVGEIGELVVKGPQVMRGYWRKPKETAEALRGGWLYTGDIAKTDGEGYFYIIDRKKDLIKYKGYSVYPREVEDVLYEHPAVKLCAVVGKPDPVAGEIPKAFIVLKEGMKTTEREIMDFVKERIAPYKAVREVEFREKLPTTSVGKVLRRPLREEELKKIK